MRPLKLTMQAFGPYATRQEVDFTKLGQKTMFVISGATGAGKTTIFDGISFAIFGKASGDDRNGMDLRSHFTHDDTLTEVSLEFELRGKRYFIIRSPQQERKKVRGDGTTTIGAKAELYELTPVKTLLASNVREVDEKIEELIQIDCHQFRQIMMIPQGEFRKLLVSDSKDKEKILQKLFHTEHFKVIEEKLKEQAVQLKKEVEQSIVERQSYLSRIQAADNEKLESLLNEEHINVGELLAELKKEVSEDETKLLTFTANITTKEVQRQQIEKEIHLGNALLEQFEIKEKLFKQKEQLDAQQPTIEKIVEAIQLANKAIIVHQHEDRCIEVARQVVTKEQELKNGKVLMTNLTTVLKEKQALLSYEENRVSEREACQKKISRLQLMEKDILSYSSLENEVKDLTATLTTINNQKTTLEEKQGKLGAKLENLQQEKEQIQSALLKKADLAVRLTTEERMLERILDLLKNKKQLIALEEQFSTEEDNRADLEVETLAKKQELEQLSEAWNIGQAGLLAQSLAVDSPCPVCGSNEHPKKAVLHEQMPTDVELKQVQNEMKQLEIEKQKVDALYYEAKTKFETQMHHVVKLADEVSLSLPHQLRSSALEDLEEHYQLQCNQLTDQLKQLEVKSNTALQLDEEMKQLTAENLKIKERLVASNDEHESLHTIFIEKRRDLARLTETIPEELRSEKVFKQQFNREQEHLKTLEKAFQLAQKAVSETIQEIAIVEGSVSSLQKIVSELKSRQQELQQLFKEKLQELNFTSVEHYSRVKLPEIEIRKKEATVQAYREELRSVTDRYLDLVERLDNVIIPDVETLHEQLKLINREISDLQEKRNILYHKVKTNSNIALTIEKINEQIATIEADFRIVGDLADIASGKNTYRVTFERYVLAAFLDDILLAANTRLSKMTNGRYQLQRKTERSKGNVQSGLELLVFDQYTGSTRHVKTLSGGESFKASLALALGLADIVQSFSGGVSMETMFIDEGFGTLDPESLENAIETLIEIQSTGRLVGIISHVPELKERIDARFEVTATQSGSVVKYYGESIKL